jgi:hypothetical protein
VANYRAESEALDAEILGLIERWHQRGEAIDDEVFDNFAVRLFEYQVRYNEPYARYCARLGMVSAPASWDRIPAVPARAFKEAALATFEPARAASVFETSGTSGGSPGRHYLETTLLYEAALLAGFDRFALPDGARLRYLNLVPNLAEQTHSSLGYMMARVAEHRGDGRTGWYLRGATLLVDSLEDDLRNAVAEVQPVCIATTAFALVHLLDAFNVRNVRFALPPDSRLMVTGGYKGRSRAVEREELDARVCDCFGVTRDAIISEYGMTELSSQYYGNGGTYSGPPWLRTRVVGPDRTTLPHDEVGSLLHVDLANRASCVAIQTEDLGVMTHRGLLLLGRDHDAALRGCSLGAEELRARS